MDTCNLSYFGTLCQTEIKKIKEYWVLTSRVFSRKFDFSQIIKWGNHMNTDNLTNVTIKFKK